MTIRTPLIASSLIAASLIAGAAHATLMGRDLNGSAGIFEAYYDTDLDITWLAFVHNSPMTWTAANAWAANHQLHRWHQRLRQLALAHPN